ncbi:HYR domain-containing protein [Ereboglobus luteus]|uniref:HYR domain-containing protein n=1 Tax=Ereboglobus luteus TaxID=1796921 RepID=A0A2U8E5Z3_9BACT|nr:HYR domain-containing protein [Ereboglobus luteus]AWI10261.1 hypothetical protein CKA38_14265 [Ereboglobus luteus]
MKTPQIIPAALALCAIALITPQTARAATANGIASFEGREEPTAIWHPNTQTFTNGDTYVNMTDQPGGVVRMELRYRGNDAANPWWDGDRSTTNKDRQRAEVKGLGAHQKTGETFEYSTTWRSNAGLTVTGKFFHFFQIKSTDGDSGAPLVVMSITNSTTAAVRVCSGTNSGFTAIRSFPWTANTWQTITIRVTTSTNDGAATGSLLVSVNGDEFQGAKNIHLYRPDATDYRPKWGLYRAVSANESRLADAYIEHKNVTVNKINADGTPIHQGILYEAKALDRVLIGAGEINVKSESAASDGRHVTLDNAALNSGMQFTLPDVPAGTYNFIMRAKSHADRGVLRLDIDGVAQGERWDLCATATGTTGYIENDFGIVRLAAGNHTVRVTSVDSTSTSNASKKYQLSADLFRLVADLVPPVITVPDDMTVDATDAGGARVTFTCTAVDAIDGPVSVTCAPASGSLFPVGETTVQVHATDSAGNKATDQFTITVLEAAATEPSITGISPDAAQTGDTITITGANLAGATVTIGGVPATILSNNGSIITVTVPETATTGAVILTIDGNPITAPQTLTIGTLPGITRNPVATQVAIETRPVAIVASATGSPAPTSNGSTAPPPPRHGSR